MNIYEIGLDFTYFLENSDEEHQKLHNSQGQHYNLYKSYQGYLRDIETEFKETGASLYILFPHWSVESMICVNPKNVVLKFSNNGLFFTDILIQIKGTLDKYITEFSRYFSEKSQIILIVTRYLDSVNDNTLIGEMEISILKIKTREIETTISTIDKFMNISKTKFDIIGECWTKERDKFYIYDKDTNIKSCEEKSKKFKENMLKNKEDKIGDFYNQKLNEILKKYFYSEISENIKEKCKKEIIDLFLPEEIECEDDEDDEDDKTNEIYDRR